MRCFFLFSSLKELLGQGYPNKPISIEFSLLYLILFLFLPNFRFQYLFPSGQMEILRLLLGKRILPPCELLRFVLKSQETDQAIGLHLHNQLFRFVELLDNFILSKIPILF